MQVEALLRSCVGLMAMDGLSDAAGGSCYFRLTTEPAQLNFARELRAQSAKPENDSCSEPFYAKPVKPNDFEAF